MRSMRPLNFPDLGVKAVILEEPARDEAAVEKMLLLIKEPCMRYLTTWKIKTQPAEAENILNSGAGCLKEGI